MTEHKLDPKYVEDMAEKGRKSLFFLTRAILRFDKMTKHIHKPLDLCGECRIGIIKRALTEEASGISNEKK